MVDIKAVLTNKAGPLPVYAWIPILGIPVAGVLIYQKKKAAASTAANGGAGTPAGTSDTSANQFQSSQTATTTDANGNQVSTQYSATGPNSFLPGMLTTQAGAMPYSGGDVYVNTSNPAPTSPTPPPQQTSAIRQPVDMAGLEKGDLTSKGAPWLATVALPGESWADVTARIYGFGTNFASLTDPAAIARVKAVTPSIQNGPGNNAPGSTGAGPAPGSIVFFH